MNQKKVAIVLSGCGHRDGSEITETVATLIALDKEGAHCTFFAPDMAAPTINHLLKTEVGSRNVLEESARIARGNIQPLTALKESDFDALVIPGGSGAAKNLSSWASAGAKCTVLPDLEKAIVAFHASSKPIGAVCIAPVVLARVLGSNQISLTTGNNPEVAAEVAKTGAIHEDCPVDDYVSDRLNKILTTPAYMYDDATPAQIFSGISKMIRELVEMA